MALNEMQKEIRRLAKEKDCVILAHNYQRPEIQDIADFIGDSLDLARKAKNTKAGSILFCGVDFMAETAAILNPDKKVIVPSLNARCPMAAMLPKSVLVEAKKKHPDAAVLLYVNTSAEAKAEADVVCTSANVAEIARAIPQRKILFGPDENLVYYVSKRVREKEFIPVPAHGYCRVHKQLITKDLLNLVVVEHPNAVVFAHPECNPDVQEAAHYILSTNGMVAKAKELPEKEFIIATENGLIHRLQREIPGKKFYGVPSAVCTAMKTNTLEGMHKALKEMKPVVTVPKELAERARKPIDRMLAISG